MTGMISWLITPVCRLLAVKFGILDHPGQRKIHFSPKPYLGGLAIYLAMYVVIIAGLVFALSFPHVIQNYFPSQITIYIPNIDSVMSKLSVLFVTGTFMFILGLLDDKYVLKPSIKFLCQIGIISVAAILGIRLDLFLNSPILSIFVTVLWITAITNALNFMDNMDGLSAGVTTIASLIFLIHSLQLGHVYMAVILAVFSGAVLGFLPHNYPVSKIFMGDAGALFIGYNLGSLTVMNSYYYVGNPNWLPLLLPLFVLSMPLFDLISVMIIRIRNHKPVYIGDKNHFSHRLIALGLSQKQSLWTIYLVTFITGCGALLLKDLSFLQGILVLVQMIAVFSVVTVLERAGRNITSSN